MIFNKLIFLHIPKTAGSSIRNTLKEKFKVIYEGTHDDYIKIGLNEKDKVKNLNINLISFNKHLPFDTIKKVNNYEEKKIFTFVRNPFSRTVSLYFECLRDKQHHIIGINPKTTFEFFLEKISKKNHWFTMPMINWIGKDNLNKLNYIGKIETIDSDLKNINKKFKIFIPFKYHNFNNSIGKKYNPPNYLEFYKNEKNIEKVQDIFKEDFENFSYDFENFKKFENKKIKKTFIIYNLIKRKIFNLLNK